MRVESGLRALQERYAERLRSRIAEAVSIRPPAEPLHQMIQYHLGLLDASFQPTQAPSGKRLRPMLCLLCAEAVGGDAHQALDAAVALELLHNFTLIHDDIEDRGLMRHHRPTVWHLWGEALAINVGDALHVRARLALLDARSQHPAEVVLTAARALDECCLKITEGQQLDMSFETRLDVRTDEYLTMIENKTARLFGCAAQLGALFGAHDPSLAEGYRRFGEALGMAFQMQDDVLGIWGDPALTGKPAADDLFKRKKTLPIIVALERATADERARLAAIYQGGEIGASEIAAILAILERVGARAATEDVAARYTHAALTSLAALSPAEPAASALADLTGLLQHRQT